MGNVSWTFGVPQALGWLTGYKSPGGLVIVRLSVAVLKHQDQKQLGEKFLLTCHTLSLNVRTHGRDLRLELKQGPQKDAAYQHATSHDGPAPPI